MATVVQEVTRGFSREAVEELSRLRNEPAWLKTRRLAAWEAYMAIPMPVRTDEEWRRTDIRDLPLDDVLPYSPEFSSRVESRSELPENVREILSGAADMSGIVVQEDSSIIYHEVRQDLAAQGVIFADMDTAIARACRPARNLPDVVGYRADQSQQVCGAAQRLLVHRSVPLRAGRC